jgi:tetratricopeptide (TPR) repeat protein
MIDKSHIRQQCRFVLLHVPIVIVAGILTATILGGCGSRPARRPAVIANSQNDVSLGMRAYQDNNYSEARNYFSRALAQYRSVDARGNELEVLVDLADSALEQGEYTEAHDYLNDAQKIIADGGHSGLEPHIALLSAYADMQAGYERSAAGQLDALLKAATTPTDIQLAALLARTQTAFDLKAADAAAWLDKSGAALGKSPLPLDSARYQRLQAYAAQTDGGDRQAAVLYASALDIYRGIYYRPGIAATLEEWAGLSIQRNDWTSARSQLQRALEVRLSMDDRTHSIRDLENLMRVDTALRDSTAAQQSSKLAIYLKNGGDPSQAPFH